MPASGLVSVLRRSEPSESAESNRTDLDLIERVDQALGVHRHGRLFACLPGGSKKVMTDTVKDEGQSLIPT